MMQSNLFERIATVLVTTKRNPAPVSGKIGLPVNNLVNLPVVPVMPVTPEIIQRYELESPRERFVTYTKDNPDVLEGDQLVDGSTTYRVYAVGEWPTDNQFLEIILERISGT